MLPNNHPSLDVRLAQLLEAIKVVYASTYFQTARDYLETTPYRIEEELMAVLDPATGGQPTRRPLLPDLLRDRFVLQLLPLRRHETGGRGGPGGPRSRQIGGRGLRSPAILPALPADRCRSSRPSKTSCAMLSAVSTPSTCRATTSSRSSRSIPISSTRKPRWPFATARPPTSPPPTTGPTIASFPVSRPAAHLSSPSISCFAAGSSRCPKS